MTKVYLIGIGGTAMATLAALLKRRGFQVSGSDEGVYPPMSDLLAAEDIPVLPGYAASNITEDIDLVIIGNALSRGNPEIEEVLDRKFRYCSLPEAIRDRFLWAARSIVVTGTHGKTTSTALIGWLLTHGGLDPTLLVGGVAGNFDASYRVGHGRDFVIEGDEYDSAFFDKTAKFLKYLPDLVVVGNLEFDHADIYGSLEEIRVAFRRLVNLIPREGLLLLGQDSQEAAALASLAHCPVETFGLGEEAGWRAYDIAVTPQGTSFRVRHQTQRFGAFRIPMLGEHNVLNALAGIAIGHAVGLDAVGMADGLAQFRGIKRRLELRGQAAGVTVYDDFAHHPTAVARTLDALRQAYPDRRIWAVFEPRSSTACRRVFQEPLAFAFRAADEAIIAGPYRTTLPEAERLSPERLVDEIRIHGTAARYIPTVDDIVTTIVRERADGDLVVLMSNGAFGSIHQSLLTKLEDVDPGGSAQSGGSAQ